MGKTTTIKMKNAYQTPKGILEIYPVWHAGVYFRWNDKNIYVDPYAHQADYTDMPKADVVLITHEHFDHLDRQALSCILTDKTTIVSTKTVAEEIKVDIVLSNDEKATISDLEVTAIPAYNIKHHNAQGKHFHPKGIGNGYVISFGGFKVYIAGDTELIPEMQALAGEIDVAFLPLCVPFTMSLSMWEEAVRTIKPKVAYPYHCTEIDIQALQKALPETKIKE